LRLYIIFNVSILVCKGSRKVTCDTYIAPYGSITPNFCQEYLNLMTLMPYLLPYLFLWTTSSADYVQH